MIANSELKMFYGQLRGETETIRVLVTRKQSQFVQKTDMYPCHLLLILVLCQVLYGRRADACHRRFRAKHLQAWQVEICG
jgi:hypothetical protein